MDVYSSCSDLDVWRCTNGERESPSTSESAVVEISRAAPGNASALEAILVNKFTESVAKCKSSSLINVAASMTTGCTSGS